MKYPQGQGKEKETVQRHIQGSKPVQKAHLPSSRRMLRKGTKHGTRTLAIPVRKVPSPKKGRRGIAKAKAMEARLSPCGEGPFCFDTKEFISCPGTALDLIVHFLELAELELALDLPLLLLLSIPLLSGHPVFLLPY
ncbi:hypothetical protein FNV43_RR08328 [Rhamnella rubrinervis]|uniref:Uncharacterized protein n=1 Tax=Rhamnella rubrinervis TaxID=2594499 RepID=A0A8K0HH05_9ROSA|nr:hypothetical protein FNV43_RR08328 [Rhamnella rubrinervis]